MKRTPLQLILIYFGWSMFSIIPYFVLDYFFEGIFESTAMIAILSIALIALIIKDIGEIIKQRCLWPVPWWFDHAPISIVIAIVFFKINAIVFILALVDSVIDVYDDVSKLKR